MIIYKIQENGKATDFHGHSNGQPIPDGYLSIGNHPVTGVPLDKIPDDKTPFHEQKYLDSLDAVAWIGERKAEYQKEGCTEEALIVALWEQIIEGRPEAADALQVKRQAVKDKIKKP